MRLLMRLLLENDLRTLIPLRAAVLTLALVPAVCLDAARQPTELRASVFPTEINGNGTVV